MQFTVAIDGPAAAGKGTVSKAIASHFGLAHLDTGLLYRAVGCLALEAGQDAFAPENAARLARGLRDSDLQRDDLRSAVAADAASKVAVVPEVRSALVSFQREFAARDGGAVLDGRDIGTVICPNADVKLFVTASAEVRARRRYDELTNNGHDTEFETVLSDVKERDARDADRATAPMKAAGDATVIDTSNLSIEAAVARALEAISEKLPQSTSPG